MAHLVGQVRAHIVCRGNTSSYAVSQATNSSTSNSYIFGDGVADVGTGLLEVGHLEVTVAEVVGDGDVPCGFATQHTDGDDAIRFLWVNGDGVDAVDQLGLIEGDRLVTFEDLSGSDLRAGVVCPSGQGDNNVVGIDTLEMHIRSALLRQAEDVGSRIEWCRHREQMLDVEDLSGVA